jgi:hypothetical protein
MEDGFVTGAAEGSAVLTHQFQLRGSAEKARDLIAGKPSTAIICCNSKQSKHTTANVCTVYIQHATRMNKGMHTARVEQNNAVMKLLTSAGLRPYTSWACKQAAVLYPATNKGISTRLLARTAL